MFYSNGPSSLQVAAIDGGGLRDIATASIGVTEMNGSGKLLSNAQ